MSPYGFGGMRRALERGMHETTTRARREMASRSAGGSRDRPQAPVPEHDAAEATMRISVTKRLGAVTAIVLCLVSAACSSGGTEAPPEDRARSSCSNYLEAYD